MKNNVTSKIKKLFSQFAPTPENEIEFRSNGVLTLGAEIELQLIDPQTQNLASRAEELLKATSHIKNIKPEFYLSTIEINTNKCENVQEIEKDLHGTISELKPISDNLGIEFSTTGSHPFARFRLHYFS